MGTTEKLRAQIDRSTQRLAQLRAREMLSEQREAVRARQANRRADVHRKIQLGGWVVDAGSGEMTGAELVGALLSYREKVVATAEREHHRQRGASHLAQQAAARDDARPS